MRYFDFLGICILNIGLIGLTYALAKGNIFHELFYWFSFGAFAAGIVIQTMIAWEITK